ncbi:hypothetical protein Hypma_016113 [Hypsizygus marmoreus]|uniref:Pre-mRNA-splicing factor 38B n=1 Tax=Hypsizygus marmoreus TaxID=39966 RepID=A0A369K6T1_HYPMA|nr:hypothetical protein Hypma_016113 [Hypsizygus marmoreus]
MASSLSSVVSDLVRASMGSSVSGMVTDEDLDRHVAELILKEAKKKAERYGQHGIRAFLPSGGTDSSVPRTNKRFLSSIIRSTDDHNKTILRAQALAAQEIKRERDELERRERRARAQEAAEAEKLRRSGRSSRRRRDTNDDESWDRWDGRTADRKRKTRTLENWDGEDEDEDKEDRERDRRKRKHRSGSRDRRRDKDRDQRSAGRSKHKRERTRSRSPRREDSGDKSSDKRSRRRRSRDRSPSRTRSRQSRSLSLDEDSRREEHGSSRRRGSRSHHRSHKSHRPSVSPPARRSVSPSVTRTEDSSSKPRKTSRPQKYALDDLESDTSSPSPRRSPRRSSSPAYSFDEAREPEPSRKSIREDVEPTAKSSKRARASPHEHSPSPGATSKRRKTGSSSSHAAKAPSVSPIRPLSRSPTPGPEPLVQLPSKMDKYFEEAYDPRLDVAPLAAPHVPATGLINNAEFEGWDAMLELIRIRREDKEEKKRMERLGLTKEKVKDKKKGGVGISDSVGDRWGSEAVSIMDIEYKKRGAVREWDLGKEGF